MTVRNTVRSFKFNGYILEFSVFSENSLNQVTIFILERKQRQKQRAYIDLPVVSLLERFISRI